MRKIKKLSQDDQDYIIGLKPYRGANMRLWLLHEADRCRKHIRLDPCITEADLVFEGGIQVVNSSNGVINGRTVEYVGGGALSPNKEVVLVSKMDKSLSLQAFPKIIYSGPADLKGVEVITHLKSSVGVVRSIIKNFDVSP